MKIVVWCVLSGLMCLSLLPGCREADTGLYHVALKDGLRECQQWERNRFADSVRYVPLETTDSCFIGDIWKMEQWGNFYYIRDLSGNLYVFTDEGKFVRKIGRIGRGPEEYNVLADFSVDPANGDVYLVDWGKIQVYSVDGQWKRCVGIDPDLQVCSFDEAGRLAFISPVGPEMKEESFSLLSVFDREGKKLKQVRGNVAECEVVYFNWLNQQEGRLFYKEEFSDTLFYLDRELAVCPYALIDFGDYRFTPALFNYGKNKEWGKYYRLLGVFDFASSLVMNVQHGLLGHEQEFYIFDKGTGEVGTIGKSAAEGGFVIDGVVGSPRFARNNQLICSVAAIHLVHNDKVADPRLQKIVRNIREDSNPVLAVLYMK